ncbi:FxSxx-COOH system tetratricopeptide repeat protein [Actinoplanes sp. NPDC051861]|uniref:FxSxx-COOH system tetratricopeptide repeat protein n=1 Tax=Actinoplanes sp. NPDC051861 TaxID=3155170 RepID=UPI003419A0E3
MAHEESIQADVVGSRGVQVGSGNSQTNLGVDAGSLPPPQRVGGGVPHNLPAATAVFEGRDLAGLRDLLGGVDARVVVGQAAVHGLGGIGKSELANQYARSYLTEYRLVWWITAENRQAIDLGLASLTKRLHPMATLADAREWALGWLQSNTGWLLVLDNVESLDDITGLLGLVTGRGHVLVTTRRNLGARWRALGMRALHLEVLERPASVRLLLELTGFDDPDGARRLAARLGDLPLGLQQAAAYISQHDGMSFDDYIVLLTEKFFRTAGDPGEGESTRQTVAAVWTVTMASVAERNALAATVLDVMGWLGADPLPESVLYPLAGDAAEVKDALALLASYSMIKRRAGSVTVHRLVQAVTRGHATADVPERTIDLLAEAAPPEPISNVTGFPMWSALLPHVQALSDHLPPGHEYTSFFELQDDAAVYQHYQGNVATAIATLEKVIAALEPLGDSAEREMLVARGHLARCLRELDRTDEAIAIEREVVAGRERIMGTDHPETLSARINLAESFWKAGSTDEAIAIEEQVVADRERILGTDHSETLTARGNLAASYAYSGRLAEAIAIEEDVLADRERTQGRDHMYTMIARANLAESYLRAGRSEEGIALNQQALADRERVLGDHHPDTLIARGSLAQHYRQVGSPDRAAALLTQVVADLTRVLGPDHPETVRAAGVLARWTAND